MEYQKIMDRLDQGDREKVIYFAGMLLRQKKYQKLRREIEERRREIERGEVLSHDEVWNSLDV